MQHAARHHGGRAKLPRHQGGRPLIIPTSVLAAPLGVRLAQGISRRKLELSFATFLALVGVRFLFSLIDR